MKKLLFIPIMFISLTLYAETIFFGLVNNASQYNLQQAKEEAKNALKNLRHPADRFGYRYYKHIDKLILWGLKEPLLNCDRIMTAYNAGIIKYKGKIEHKNGYIRNKDFYLIQNGIEELERLNREADPNYDVGVSTP